MMVAMLLQVMTKIFVLLNISAFTTPLEIVMIIFLTIPILMKLYQQNLILFVTKNITKVYWELYTLLLCFVDL